MPNSTQKEIAQAVYDALKADATLAAYINVFNQGRYSVIEDLPFINVAVANTTIETQTVGRRGFDTHEHTIIVETGTMNHDDETAYEENFDTVNNIMSVIHNTTLDGKLEMPSHSENIEYLNAVDNMNNFYWGATITVLMRVRVQRTV